jgi:hypothetical protein
MRTGVPESWLSWKYAFCETGLVNAEDVVFHDS